VLIFTKAGARGGGGENPFPKAEIGRVNFSQRGGGKGKILK